MHVSATLGGARSRLGLPDFALETPLPATIAQGASTALRVRSTPTSTGEREDVLFFDLVLGSTTVRYPITLFAPTP